MVKSIKDFEVKNKRILVRCDFNVPLDENGAILDDFRIRKTLPTIEYLVKNEAKIILISHLGEPEGKIIENVRLGKVGDRLESLLNMSIIRASDCVGDEVKKRVLELKSGEVMLLENVRFHQEEMENDLEFAKELAEFGNIFINDAFSDCHRPHASIIGIPQFLPHGMGLLLQQEVESLTKILKNPMRPLVVLIGGKKVVDKVKFVKRMLDLSDSVIISGLIKNELIKEKHSDILQNVRMIGPENNLEALDIDEETIEIFKEKIAKAKTIVWNGPFGKIEDEKYKNGTLTISKAIIESGAFSVVGGGETTEFLDQEGLISKFSWVSTGGGAMLDFLSGEELPGLKALEN